MILRPVTHEDRELLLEGVIDLLKHFARRRKGLRELLAHTEGLTALAGKDKGKAHERGSALW